MSTLLTLDYESQGPANAPASQMVTEIVPAPVVGTANR
jgi:hypothetical protein